MTFTKGAGLNESEKYLANLCAKTFLSLWSYPNVYRQPGSELCDLLVICNNHIIIFSDKSCKFKEDGDLQINWNRWYRKAISNSADQLWGAENWIKSHPRRVFLDSKCEQPFPTEIEVNDQTIFHLILVAHGSSRMCKKTLGGSGSMMYSSKFGDLRPFVTVDLNQSKSFVHILDDITLNILLENLNTITDFTGYLTKKKNFLRSNFRVVYIGEEEMLGHYLTTMNSDNEHAFVESDQLEGNQVFFFDEGLWDYFLNSEGRKRQIEADSISYNWDVIIEEFSEHAINNTQHYVSEGGFHDSERAIRFLALENRFQRRILSSFYQEHLLRTPIDKVGIRMMKSNDSRGVWYLFLIFPNSDVFNGSSYEEYREARRQYLSSACLIVRLKFPEVQFVVGIASEPLYDLNRSHDLVCFDASIWCDELAELAKEDQEALNILKNPLAFGRNMKEYPD